MRSGRLDLLEIAQVAPEERNTFMDIERFRVFNTNNVWVDLDALWEALNDQDAPTAPDPEPQTHQRGQGDTT